MFRLCITAKMSYILIEEHHNWSGVYLKHDRLFGIHRDAPENNCYFLDISWQLAVNNVQNDVTDMGFQH